MLSDAFGRFVQYIRPTRLLRTSRYAKLLKPKTLETSQVPPEHRPRHPPAAPLLRHAPAARRAPPDRAHALRRRARARARARALPGARGRPGALRGAARAVAEARELRDTCRAGAARRAAGAVPAVPPAAVAADADARDAATWHGE